MYALQVFIAPPFSSAALRKSKKYIEIDCLALITTLMSDDGLVYYLMFNTSKRQSRMDISETLAT